MRYLLMLAAWLSIAPIAAHAEEWPVHGFYRVQSAGEGAERLCRLRVEVSVDGSPFAFILSQHGPRSWTAQLMAKDARLLDASEVYVGFDRESVFHFTPTERDPSPELPNVTGELGEGSDVIGRLMQRAGVATWFQVAALPYYQSVPAAGMKDALDDMAACRAVQRRL